MISSEPVARQSYVAPELALISLLDEPNRRFVTRQGKITPPTEFVPLWKQHVSVYASNNHFVWKTRAQSMPAVNLGPRLSDALCRHAVAAHLAR